ncbi:MAG: hypothetical protein AB7O59_09760 [Pirellulales bacterium]
MNRRAVLVVLASSAIVTFLAAPATAQGLYHLTDLGALSGGFSTAYGLNANGQVAGYSRTANGADHAFLYSGGIMQDLGTFGGTRSRAYGINSSGQVVGDYIVAGLNRAFLYSAGTMQDLGTLGGPLSQAFAINDSEDIVGLSFTLTGAIHPFRFSSGVMQDLGTTLASATGRAWGINASGQIAGDAYPTGVVRAAVYEGGGIQYLGSLGGPFSTAGGINENGVIVGSSTVESGPYHAFQYSGGVMLDLGTLPGGSESFGLGINSSGQSVGFSNGDGFSQHGFLFDNGTVYDLNNLLDSSGVGWTVTEARAINDLGWIAGTARGPHGDHAVLLTLVPEPSTRALALGAAVSLVAIVLLRLRDHGRPKAAQFQARLAQW